MVLIWSLRLTWFLLYRYFRTPEDSRYQEIKKNLGDRNLDFKVLAMFFVQRVLLIIISLIFLVISQNRQERFLIGKSED